MSAHSKHVSSSELVGRMLGPNKTTTSQPRKLFFSNFGEGKAWWSSLETYDYEYLNASKAMISSHKPTMVENNNLK